MLAFKPTYHFLLLEVHPNKIKGGYIMRYENISELVKDCKMDYRYHHQGEFVERILWIRNNIPDGDDYNEIKNKVNEYYSYRFTVSVYDLNDAIINFCIAEGIFKDNNELFARYNAEIYKNNILCTLWSMICISLIDNPLVKRHVEDEYIWYSDIYRIPHLEFDSKGSNLDRITTALIERFTIHKEDISILMDYHIFDRLEGFSIEGFNVKDIAKFVVGQDPIY